MVLAGLITVILGWKLDSSQNIDVQTNTVISFMSGLAAFWDIDNYKFRIKAMGNNLKVIRYELTLRVTGETPLDEDKLKGILDNIISVINDGYWEEKTK